MRYRFVTADVFTDRIFGGNPLAVLPDAGGLDAAQMQDVAREFNLSETVFVLPPEDPANTRRVRIFTPGAELPFAGHPTVGTAVVLAEQGLVALAGEVTEIVLEEGAGAVPVTLRRRGGELLFAQLTAPRPAEVRPGPEPASAAALLSVGAEDVERAGGLPACVSCGVPFVLVRLRTADALRRARLDPGLWQRMLQGAWASAVFLFTTDAGGTGADFRARMFAPDMGIGEDPATGAAAAALGGWLGANGGLGEGTHRFRIAQGLELGRPSRIEVEVERRAGRAAAVRIGGTAVLVSEGTIEVPEHV